MRILSQCSYSFNFNNKIQILVKVPSFHEKKSKGRQVHATLIACPRVTKKQFATPSVIG